ncbi:MAG: hypothetical protein LBV68_01365 [Spirochaetaceae bacterium]|jgi:hypothetical protein|nr:hypothetical protein [Spirochaetaceae bacterium]
MPKIEEAMFITINEKPIDITIENEKTVGELVAGIDLWLAGSGFVICALVVNDKASGASALDNALTQSLNEVSSIDIKTQAAAEICVDALLLTREMLEKWAVSDNGEKAAIELKWSASPAASFFQNREPEIYLHIKDIFTGKNENTLEPFLSERTRELDDPIKEFLGIEERVDDTAARLSDFALDLQTGKEPHAAETVKIFSVLSAKLFRLIPLLRSSGIDFETVPLEKNFFENLNLTLKEFLAVYEAQDTVLSGDLAEYEMAPRLHDLYDAVQTKIKEHKAALIKQLH